MDSQELSKSKQETIGVLTGPTGRVINRPPMSVILYAQRMKEVEFSNKLFFSIKGTNEEIAKQFVDTLIFKIGKLPKKSCKHCYGRGYSGFTDVWWHVKKDGSISIEFPKDVETNRIHYTRIYPCTCIGSFEATTIDKLNQGDLYLSMSGGDILKKEAIKQNEAEDKN